MNRLFSARRQFGLGCCRTRLIGCVFVLILLLVFGFAAALYALPASGAELSELDRESDQVGQTIHFLIDNSLSMYPINGAGSDPDQLRIAATRLFISYLGVDASRARQRVSVVFFGSQPDLIVPPAELDSSVQRRQIFEQIENPDPYGWTDPAAALELAAEQFSRDQQDVVVLLTDGYPEFDGVTMTDARRESYSARLQALSESLQAQDIPLFVILLTNDDGQVSNATSDEQAFWLASWQTLAAVTPPGQLFVVSDPDELTAVYHAVITTVSKRESAGEIFNQTLESDSIQVPVLMEEPVADMSLIIGRGGPSADSASGFVDVQIIQPDGTELSAQSPLVEVAPVEESELADVWTIRQPAVGVWEIRLTGSGDVTILHDTSSPLPKSNLAAATPTASSSQVMITPSSTATSTSVPPSPTSTAAQDVVLMAEKATATKEPVELVLIDSPAGAPEPVLADLPARPWWRWVMFSSLIGAGSVIILLALGQARVTYPVVSGYLQPLVAHGAAEQSLFELDSFQTETVSIGPAEADIPLPGTIGTARMTAKAIRPGETGIFLSGSDTVKVNQTQLNVGQEIPLFDGDIIAFDGIPFRYENLRLMRN